jgi:probable phosphoglycerate mutase
MILKKEFYFVRHGQTDHNLHCGIQKGEDHPADIPLNETGKNQALLIEPTIASLPIQTICASPLKRVQQTKEIIAPNLQVEHHIIDDLSECSALIWKEMVRHGMYSSLPQEGIAREFMDRILRGINQALALPGPTLVVAHGGVHWALCCLMGIQEHEWAITNCLPVHFSVGEQNQWIAKKLTY